MNKILHHIRSIKIEKNTSARLVDICWIIFGPPFSILLASNFEVEILFIISKLYKFYSSVFNRFCILLVGFL